MPDPNAAANTAANAVANAAARLTRRLALVLAAGIAAGCGRDDGRPAYDRPKGADTASLAGAVPDPGVVTSRSDGTVASPAHDWATVRARDTLRVVAPFNSTTYFIYRGLPLGSQRGDPVGGGCAHWASILDSS